MDPPANAPLSSSSSLRFLARPPPPASNSAQNPNTSTSKPPSPPPDGDGVVVVGFLSSRPAVDASHLINRLLDSHVFASAALDRDLRPPRTSPWFNHRRVSYYRDEERGIVFLNFRSDLSRLQRIETGTGGGRPCDMELDEWEADDLRGMLFMFSVCHVIIFLHEGSQFDTHILKKLRMLQRAKNSLAPIFRSQFIPAVASRSPATSLQISVPQVSSRSPGRASGGRHGSAVSLVSGPGSHISLLPGNCVPVVLFVFYDEFMDGTNCAPGVDELSDSYLNQSSVFSGTNKTNPPLRGSGSVMVLARPSSKIETSFRKKLQSSLDSQIRFLIKKCRTLVGSEYGSRGAGSASSLPLFSLDASRAVVLLDKSSLCTARSLDYVTSRLEDALTSKLALDTFVPEGHNQVLSGDDIQAIRDFIHRQSDSLKGRGALATNTSSGSAAAGVGMVAAAAAAAAASAASGKLLSTPKLPSMDVWESFCNHALDILLSVKCHVVDGFGLEEKLLVSKKTSAESGMEKDEIGNTAAEAAIAFLKSNVGLNMRFSIAWCERVLPSAKEIYLRDLPTCYPTSLHKLQLEKALHAFRSMVKGPAMPSFVRKLEDDCNSIWKSGRQLCDAVSLTGKPCMHQRHDDSLGSSVETKQHLSGYVFLHACACGRSRRIRDDPFDWHSANVSYNYFPNCEKFLPALELPKGNHEAGPLYPAWSLVRLGGIRYYEPSKGLLQSGFCSNEKYLSEWKVALYKPLDGGLSCSDSTTCSTPNHTVKLIAEKEVNKVIAGSHPKEVRSVGPDYQKKDLDNASLEEPHVQFGRGFPPFVAKKAFSEVVAGTTSSHPSSFPPLQAIKQLIINGSEKGTKVVPTSSLEGNHDDLSSGYQNSEESKDLSIAESFNISENNSRSVSNPFLQIGSNIVPVNINSKGKVQKSSSEKKSTVYFGFEHECPHGHRFFLSEEHLQSLGSFYSLPGACPSVVKNANGNHNQAQLDAMNKIGNGHSLFAKTIDHAENKSRSKYQSSVSVENYSLQQARKVHQYASSDECKESSPHARFDHNGHTVSLLNRNLPIYMNCPHCQKFTEENEQSIKFASTVSQLQRIFVGTPSFPIVLASSPVIQFEVSCIPPIPNIEKQSQFSLGCRLILPPDSFLSLRLPFVYGVQLGDHSLQPLHCTEQNPELTAWLVKGTALYIVSKDIDVNDSSQMH